MILQNPDEYGVLTDLVSGAGSLIAVAGALALGWRGRIKKWEPSEEDIDRGPQKVGSLVVVIAIAILWTQTRNPSFLPFLNNLAFSLVATTVVALIVYGILVGVFTCDKKSAAGGKLETKRIIGGFWLTRQAKHTLARKEMEDPPVFLTKQELLFGAGYDPDKVWSRFSRALKAAFVIAYLALTASGTIALACASIILGIGQQK
jgi:hypothetical protein